MLKHRKKSSEILNQNNKKLQEFGLNNPCERYENHYSQKEYDGENKMSKTIKGEKSVKLDDGKHTGIITKIEYVNEPYEYTHIYIKEDKTQAEIKLGVATKITENTALGKLLNRFGSEIEVGTDYDVEAILINKKVQFMTITKGKFANIVEDSVKPL
jgi:hypothetical protein